MAIKTFKAGEPLLLFENNKNGKKNLVTIGILYSCTE